MSDWMDQIKQNAPSGGGTLPQGAPPPTSGHPQKQKSLMVAYVLAIFFGWFGAHRIYLGNYLMGATYMFTMGGMLVGWFIDVLFLPGIVRRANERLANPKASFEDAVIEEAEYDRDHTDHPLYSGIAPYRWMKYFGFLIMMSLIPAMYYSFFGDLTFAFILVLLYFVTVYNKEIGQIVAQESFPLWSIPGLRSRMLVIVNGFAKLRQHYAGRKAPGLIRSIFSGFMVPFSKDLRKEWKLFNGLLAFGMIFVIIQFAGWGYEYFTIYRPQLTIKNLLIDIKLINMAIGGLMIITIVIPIVRTLTYVELAGEKKKGRILVVLATIGALSVPFLNATEHYPYEEYQRLRLRLRANKAFQKDINLTAKSFLLQHYRPARFGSFETQDKDKNPIKKLKNSRVYVRTSIRLTRQLRRKFVNEKKVIRSEVNGFRVLAFSMRRDGSYQPGLLVFLGYNKDDVDWSHLHIDGEIRKLKGFARKEAIGKMWEILLDRMKEMGKGDQLSPDYKGKDEPEPSAKQPPARVKKQPKVDKKTIRVKDPDGNPGTDKTLDDGDEDDLDEEEPRKRTKRTRRRTRRRTQKPRRRDDGDFME